jgi:hypothetical protein
LLDFVSFFSNMYVLYDPAQTVHIDYIKSVIESYDQSAALGAAVLLELLGAAIAGRQGAGGVVGLIAGQKLKEGFQVTCPYNNCGLTFTLHTAVQTFPCPSCRQVIRMRY